MEPITTRTRGEELPECENPVLDRKYSDGQLEALFLSALRKEEEMDLWLSRSTQEVSDLFRDAVTEAKPGWTREQVNKEVDRLRGILGRALLFRLKADICHRASRSLERTAADLRAIAADSEKTTALRRRLQDFPGGAECLENICGKGWDGSNFDLRCSLLEQAKRMDRLAEGLHVKDLLGNEDPLRDNPELVRHVYEQLPAGSFAWEIFPSQLENYQQRREFNRDALTMWKGLCNVPTAFVGSLGPLAGLVSRLYSAGSTGLDAHGAASNFSGATLRANAAMLSGGARPDDYRLAVSERDIKGTADGIGIAISLGTLAAGKLLPDGEKAALKLALSFAKTFATGVHGFAPNTGRGESIDRIIHRLAGS